MSSAYFSGSAADLSSSYRLCQSNAGAVTLCNIPVHDGYVLSWSETRANAAPVSLTAALLNDGGQGYTLAFNSNNTAALSYQASNTIPAVPLVSGPCTLGLSNDVAWSMVLERGRVSLNGLEILSCSNLSDVEWSSASLAISGATLSNRVSLCNVDGLPLYTIEPPVLARGGIITPYLKGRLDWGDLSNVLALAPLSLGTWGSNAAVAAQGVAAWSSNLAVAAQGVAAWSSNLAAWGSNQGGFYRDAGNMNAGTLAVARGGTGVGALAQGKVLVGNGTGAVLQPTDLTWDGARLGVGSVPAYKLDVGGLGRIQTDLITATSRTLHADRPFGSTTTNRRYGLVATVGGNNGLVRICGICGGHESVNTDQGKTRLDMVIDGRNNTIRGTVSTHNSGWPGLVVYKANTGGGDLSVYLTGGNYFRYSLQLWAADAAATFSDTVSWSTDAAWTAPGGSTLWLDTVTHLPKTCLDCGFYMDSAVIAAPVIGACTLSNGFMGIGTATPSSRLQVEGDLRADMMYESNVPLSTRYAASNHSHPDVYFTMNAGAVYTASNVFLGGSTRVGGQICTTTGTMAIALSNAAWNNAQECRIANYNHGLSNGSNAFLYLAISPKHDAGYGRGYVQVAGFGYCNNVSQGLQPLNFVSRLGVNSSNPGTYWLDCRGAANADSLSESNVMLSTKYALSNHVHSAAAVTGLAAVATTGSYASLLNIPATFAPAAHTHTMADLGASMVKLGDMGFAGLAGWCHASAASTTTDYAFLQELGAGKSTYMNAPLGGRLRFRVNNVDQMEVLPGYGATRSSLNWPVVDPGRMIQCWYGAGDAYGVGQFSGGTMRAFMSSFASATFNVSKCAAGLDNSYVDLLTVDTDAKVTIKGSSAASSGLYWNYGGSKIYDDGHLRLDTDNNLQFDIGGATAGEFTYRGIRLMQDKSICMVCDGTAAPYWEWELATGIDGTDHLGNFSWTIWWPDGATQAGETVAYLDDNSLDTRRLNFTGCHRCVAEKGLKTAQDVLDATGLVVIATGRYCSLLEETVKPRQIDNITVDEALPTIELCTKRRDKHVFGVVSAPDNLIEAEVSRGEDGKPARKLGGKKRGVFKQGAFATCAPYDTDRVEINSLGEGAVWVCARGGNFENGDFITTSDLAGYGERQEEPYVCGWTLGKITCDVDWSRRNLDKDFQTRTVDGALCALVGCVYLL